EDIPNRRPAIILPALFPTVELYTACHQALMITPQKSLFHLGASLRIPEDRDHVSEVARTDVRVPQLPINKDRATSRLTRVEKVPHVCVAVCERQTLRCG